MFRLLERFQTWIIIGAVILFPLLVYRANCADPTAATAGDDADAIGFFSLTELPPISHHTHRQAIEDWFDEQARRSAL